MKQVKGTDALEALSDRYGIDPNDEGIAEAREQMAVAQLIYDARNEADLHKKNWLI